MIDTSKLSNEVRYAIASNLGWQELEDAGPYIEMIRKMTPEEAFGAYLYWYGIIGYTDRILNALKELRNADQETEAA